MRKTYNQSNSIAPLRLTRLNRITRGNKEPRIGKQSISQLVDKATVDYSVALEAPPTIMSINDKSIATLGNFSLVTGKAKAKKTFFISLAIGSLQSSNSNSVIKIDQSLGDFEVLYFDTEQSKHKVIEVAQRICTLNSADIPYNRLKVFGLRPFSTQERIDIIQSVIYSSPRAKLVVIDGARDLVHSINSEEEASKISNLFLKWTADMNIHIMTILHENKSKKDTNARGHLGTELVNKAETTLSVKAKNDGVSLVTCSYSRELEFQPFTFQVNEEGLPEIVSGNSSVFSASPESIHNYRYPADIPDEKRKAILDILSQKSEQFRYNDLVDAIKEAVQEVAGEDIGQNAAKRYKIYFEDKGFIEKDGKAQSSSAYYTININLT